MLSMISGFMAAAVEAAEQVRGSTSPNPWVGAVLVANGEIVRQGATGPAGGMHAEAWALASGAPTDATLYVTLEPCVPFEGKRTPPCAARIIDAGVGRVVVAVADPDPRVGGRGIAMLREAGVEVTLGDGAAEVARQLRPYLKHRQTGFPYVIAKFAASLDGRTSANTGDSQWITGEDARARVHVERARVDAIIAGSGTVLADDPALTARPGGVEAARQPLRVLLDTRGRISPTARALHGPGQAIVATSQAANPAWKQSIVAAGATVIECEAGENGLNLHQLLGALARRGVVTAWIEGGATLLGSFFDDDLVDELWAFMAPSIIGGRGLPAIGGAGVQHAAQARLLRDVQVEMTGQDVLIRGYTGPWEYQPAASS